MRTKRFYHIPETGPALLIANHISYLDAILIAAHVKRPITFVMYHGIYDMAPWLFRALGAVPIASKTEKPAVYRLAMMKVRQALDAGGLVCIFPEGMITRDGQMNEFKPGMLKILARNPVDVVPIGIRGLWGSYFSFRYGKSFLKIPKHWFAKVEIEAGTPMSPSMHIDAMRDEVFRLSAVNEPLAAVMKRGREGVSA